MYFFLANFCLLEFTLHHINVTLWQQVKFFFGVFNNPFQLKNNTLFLVAVSPYGCHFDTVLCCIERDRSSKLTYLSSGELDLDRYSQTITTNYVKSATRPFCSAILHSNIENSNISQICTFSQKETNRGYQYKSASMTIN